MNKKHDRLHHWYGTVTIGEKGQIVIPVEARENFNLKKGDKLMFVGKHKMLALVPVERLEKFAEHLSRKLQSIQDLIKEQK